MLLKLSIHAFKTRKAPKYAFKTLFFLMKISGLNLKINWEGPILLQFKGSMVSSRCVVHVYKACTQVVKRTFTNKRVCVCVLLRKHVTIPERISLRILFFSFLNLFQEDTTEWRKRMAQKYIRNLFLIILKNQFYFLNK